jgi:hypothetical protein
MNTNRSLVAHDVVISEIGFYVSGRRWYENKLGRPGFQEIERAGYARVRLGAQNGNF